MYSVKTTNKSVLTLKNIQWNGVHFANEDGEVVDIVSLLKQAFGSDMFTVNATLQVNEETPLDEDSADD